jgi:hypothetical protein
MLTFAAGILFLLVANCYICKNSSFCVTKGTGLQDKSLIKALIQTKHWDKAIWKEYLEKHPDVAALAKKKKKPIEELINVDLSYKWRANLKYSQDSLTRLTLMADTLPPEKRQELFQYKPVLDFVRSLLGEHSYFMNEHRRLLAKWTELEHERQEKSIEFEMTRAKLSGSQRTAFEKEQTEQIFRPLSMEMEAIEKKMKEIANDAIAWNKSIMQQESVARIAAEIAKACLDFCVNHYNRHVDDPAMQKVFADLFGNTKEQLDSLLRQVNDKKELSRLTEELKKSKGAKVLSSATSHLLRNRT